jgi:hypothetical protein
VAALAATVIYTPFLIHGATYNSTLQFSTGNYVFPDRTNSLSLTNGLTLGGDVVSFSVSVPVIYQNSPWISFGGVGLIPSGGTEHSDMGEFMRGGRDDLLDTTRQNRVGVGDPLLSANVKVTEGGKIMPMISLTGSVKPPLVDAEQGFGTGEWDYGAGVSLGENLKGTYLFADLSYWILGDYPDLELQDPVNYSLAVGRPLKEGNYIAMISYSGSTPILDDVNPPQQVDLSLSYLFVSGSSLMWDVGFGLSESSPDFSASMGWGIEF